MVDIVVVIVENEVQDTYRINGVQLVVPVATLGLLADGESGVIDHSVHEVVLIHVLHLHDDMVAFVGGAIRIENGPARIHHLI